MSYQNIIKDIAKGSYKPVYFLHGEEPYFIDLVEKFALRTIVDESAREFDQSIFYGKDTELQHIVNSAKRFPMMGAHQVIAVREAQHIKKFDELIHYCKNPQHKTILIFSYKGKKLDARVAKKITNTEFLDSKRLYDNQIPGWIVNQVASEGLKIDEKSAVLISEYLGNDLSKIANELKKLAIAVPKQTFITPEIIEHHIGISKEFNLFELSAAIAHRDIVKCNRIVNHFAANEKNYPIVVTIPSLYRLFSKIMGVYFSPSDQPDIIAKTIGVNKFFIRDYTAGKRNYSKRQIFNAISLLNEYDLKAKGYGNVSVNEGELLRELVFKIMH